MKKLLLLITFFATSITFGQTLTNAVVPATAELGETITISFDFTTDGVKEANKAYITLYQGTPGVTDPAPAWTYGKQPLIEPNATSGTVTVTNFTIPTTVDDTLDWFIRVTYTHSDGSWFGTPFEQVIDLTPAPVADSIAFDPANPSYSADTSLTINFIYTSDTEIPAGGIRITYWTTIDVPSFCDQWRGTAVTSETLPAGENLSGSITIGNFNSAITNEGTTGGTIMTTDEINANQVNSGEADYPGAGSIHYWQFRILDADTSDDYSITQILTPAVITANTASVEDEALSHIKVYPNPTADKIYISDLTNINTITVSNILGKQVLSVKAQKSIDISNLSKGVYFLQTDNGLRRKIIKN